MHYVSTKKVREHDMRPRFDDDTHEQIIQEAACFSVPKNLYLHMMVKAFLKLPREQRIQLLFNYQD